MGVDLMGGHHEFYHVISATDDITQCNLLIHEMSRMCPGGNCHNMQHFSKFLQHSVACKSKNCAIQSNHRRI